MNKIIDDKESIVTKVINKAGDSISRLLTYVDNIRGKWLETCTMLLYAIIHFVISYYHEPWFDEAEAWQIARCASFHDLIFEIPHLEGHSPMWDFILIPWIKSGIPYELSLSLISFLFMGTAVALIIWKAPWPRLVRLILPFTYFFLYQYGVVCRPYCAIACLLILIAYLYPTKDDKPARFVVCLALLAYIHAYGLLMAGGIAIVWLVEIWNKRKFTEFVKGLLKDKRAWLLLGLLVVALLTVLQIMPSDDTYGILEQYERNGAVKRILYVFFALPAETTFTTVWQNAYGLAGTELDPAFLTIAIGCGVVFWLCAIVYGRRKKKALLLFLPYFFFAMFAGYTYISRHHIGVGILWIVSWFWMSCYEEVEQDECVRTYFDDKNAKFIQSTLKVCAAFVFAVSLYWSVYACIVDIGNVYAFGKKEADFIKENGLEQYNIMSEFGVIHYEGTKDIAYYFLNDGVAVNILPYFSDNIVYNFNEGQNDKGYVIHRVNTKEKDEEEIQRLKNIKPQVLLGDVELEIIYGDEYNINEDYTLVNFDLAISPWKDSKDVRYRRIYVLNEIAEEKGLKKAGSEIKTGE